MKRTCIVLALALLLVLGAEAQRRFSGRCPTDYRPVCGRDRRILRTFYNECELHAFNYRENTNFKIIKRKPC